MNRKDEEHHRDRRTERRDDSERRNDEDLSGGYNDLEGTRNLDTARDYEQNAGYRASYNRLTTGNGPEAGPAQPHKDELQHRSMPAGVTHRGKGPRSYQRSDDRIREDINDALMEDPYVDASEIDVAVTKGEVVITGIVDDKNVKRRVEDVILNISGVRDVFNKVQTRVSGGQVVNIRNSQA